MNKFIQMYKSIQRNGYFKNLGKYKHSYAFAGAGKHSQDNLYPCIYHLGIPLKFICTRHIHSAKSMSGLFPGCMGIDSIEPILNDTTVKGVFVCLPPENNFDLVKLLLEHKKNVFVEKPLGYSLHALKQIVSVQNGFICQVGLQRRFSRVKELLKKLSVDSISYNYRFLVGAYPEGNALYDVFIHPVDLVIQVFGSATVASISSTGNDGTKTFFITLKHTTVTGIIELSTNHTWQQPVDELVITCSAKIITARYPNHVSTISKAPLVLNMPLEKIRRQPLKQSIYLEGNHITPVAELNSLNLQGFYGEIRHFVQAVETNKPDQLCSAESLLPAYEILDQLQRHAT